MLRPNRSLLPLPCSGFVNHRAVEGQGWRRYSVRVKSLMIKYYPCLSIISVTSLLNEKLSIFTEKVIGLTICCTNLYNDGAVQICAQLRVSPGGLVSITAGNDPFFIVEHDSRGVRPHLVKFEGLCPFFRVLKAYYNVNLCWFHSILLL